jgi:hypothetical protein
MSKAPQTVHQYAVANRTQQNLDRWLGLTSGNLPSTTQSSDQTDIVALPGIDDPAQLDHTFDVIPADILVALNSMPCGNIAVDGHLTKQSDMQDTGSCYQNDYVLDCKDNIETLSSDAFAAGI